MTTTSVDTVKHIAAVATDSTCVAADYCDVGVYEAVVNTYREDNDGNEIPVYEMGSVVVMPEVETAVRTDDDDKLALAGDAADEILRSNGWIRTDDWGVGPTALYAPVERA